MSRSEEFQSAAGKRPLFHGTTATLKLGDIVYPSTHDKHPDGPDNASDRDYEVQRDLEDHFSNRDTNEHDDRDDNEVREDYQAYASHHWDNAWSTPDLENAKGYAGKNGGRVYQVEHLSPEGCEGCNFPNNPAMDDHTDSSGFRVVKQVQ
jgi:hypothetical protein